MQRFAFASAVATNLLRRCQCLPLTRARPRLPTSRTLYRTNTAALSIRAENRTPSLEQLSTSSPDETYHDTEYPQSTSLSDTIFALSSGSLGVVSGVAVLRISGVDAHWAVSQLLPRGSSLPKTRRAGVRHLIDPTTKQPLDQALVLTFAAPASFTGEDVAELHVHGSRAVLRGVLEALSSLSRHRRLRAADRGEFTRRAFENGRLDLTAVEGLADLLAADTERQRIQALRAAGGAARRAVEAWRTEALYCLAHAEATLDFADDVDDGTFDAVVPRAQALADAITARVARDGRVGEIVRDGVRVAIVGAPNAGKSSLLNALAKREVAIVADIPGTTRDVITVALDLHGISVSLADTAGIREEAGDEIEAEGMRRAREAADDAHIALVMCDARSPHCEVSEYEANVICVANKIDLLGGGDVERLPGHMLRLSLKMGGDNGLDGVVEALGEAVRKCALGNEDEAPVVTRVRHRYHLERAADALGAFANMRSGEVRLRMPMDVAAEELRIACKEIGAVVGAIHVEDVLDVVFKEFCIGK